MTRRPEKRVKKGSLLLLLILALLAVRLWLDNTAVVTKEYDIVSAAVPPGFDGLRIAQISDLHGTERLYPALLRRTAAAKPDLIFLTGDLSDDEGQWEALSGLLEELCALAPCYYCSGNHEWAELAPEPFFRRLSELGVTVLRNAWVPLERGGEVLAIAGLEDPNGYADMATPEEVMVSIRAGPEAPVLVLCHRPGLFPRLAAAGYGLVFSGHNHGGLIRLPLLGGLVGPAGFFPEYDAGLFSLGESVMLVSPGLAASNGVPRFLNRPEISVAVLHPAK